MGFGFGVYSAANEPVYASGYVGNFAVSDAGFADVVLTEDTDSHASYDGTTFTVPSNMNGTYLIMCQVGQKTADSIFVTAQINGVDDDTQKQEGDSDLTVYIRTTYWRVVALTVGQTVKMRAYTSHGGGATALDGRFWITRL